MFIRTSSRLMAAAALAAATFGVGQADAATVGMEVFYNPGSADTSGLNLVLDVAQSGSDFVFTFTNLSGDGSSMINFYFESGLKGHYLMTGPGTRTSSASAGANIGGGATPVILPGGDGIDWASNMFSYGAEGMGQNKIANGIDGAGESLTVTVAGSGASLGDLLDALTNAHSRIAIGVMGAGGQSLVFVTKDQTPVNEEEPSVTGAPTPAAALGGMTLLGMLGLARRRQD